MTPGARNLITDVAGLRVGHAADTRIKTGTTVLIGEAPMTCGVAVMGGAPGTRETDLLAPDKTVQQVHALVLSGGSAFGLGAADGVMAGLRERGIGFAVGPHSIPIVPAAILFDLMNGGDKTWGESPYPALGRAAFEAADVAFALGTVGAGVGATTATLKGGLGSASMRLASGVTVGALVAANPVGCVGQDEEGRFWAAPHEIGAEFGGLGVSPAPLVGMPVTKLDHGAPGQNTTLAIVATDAALSQADCTRMATAAHDGMARAILPAHTPLDGDIVFGVSTGAVPLGSSDRDTLEIGHAAATCLARAIARAVFCATPASADPNPTWGERFGKSAGRGAAKG